MASSSHSRISNTDLKGSILKATSEQKSLLCFVADGSSTSQEWESILCDPRLGPRLNSIVTVRLESGSQEQQYLNAIAPLSSTPAIVIVHNGQIEHNLQSSNTSTEDLSALLESLYGPEEDTDTTSTQAEPQASKVPQAAGNIAVTPSDATRYIELAPSTGRMRLSNNAYDALRAQTSEWVEQKIRGDLVLRLQLRLLSNVPGLQETIKAIQSRSQTEAPTLPQVIEEKLLNTSAAALKLDSSSTASKPTGTSASAQRQTATPPSTSSTQPPTSSPETSTPTSSTPTTPSTSQTTQRNQYLAAQRAREASQKAEKDRIKATIASQRAEKARLDSLRKQSDLATLRTQNSTITSQPPSSTDVRIQVRAFDGSRMTNTFLHNATVTTDVRPWIDSTVSASGTARNAAPYNLKLILTPLPNRTIEAGEEDSSLSDLGIVASATMVMVPVKGYVESYAGSSGGLFSYVTGAVGGVVNGIGSMLGYGTVNARGQGGAPSASEGGVGAGESGGNATASKSAAGGAASTNANVRIRTLADQRADEEGKGKGKANELYNGNQTNFQGRKDDQKREDV